MIRIALAPHSLASSTWIGWSMKSFLRQGGPLAQRGGDAPQVVQGAPEVFLVGEDRERVGAGGPVGARLLNGGSVLRDVARRGRASLDLRKDGQPSVAPFQCGSKRTRPGKRRIERRQLVPGHVPDPRGDFPALVLHDLYELVGHAPTKHHCAPENPPESLPPSAKGAHPLPDERNRRTASDHRAAEGPRRLPLGPGADPPEPGPLPDRRVQRAPRTRSTALTCRICARSWATS